MKSQISKEVLVDTPETKAKVSPDLHQNIMRAVRLARSHDKSTPPVRTVRAWAVPAWGAGMAMLVLAVFYLARTAPGVPAPGPQAQSAIVAQTQKPAQKVSLMVLGDKLTTLSGNTLLPEKELMEEYERLKSDLERLGFRS